MYVQIFQNHFEQVLHNDYFQYEAISTIGCFVTYELRF